MEKVKVYTMDYCPYCEMAKRLLEQKGVTFEEIRVSYHDDATWKRLEKQTGYKTMPQIFIGKNFVGGYVDLAALNQSGKLDTLLKSA